jgi:hypothetical protein
VTRRAWIEGAVAMSRCKWGDIRVDGRAGVHGGGLASYEAGTKMVDGYRVVPWKGACAFLEASAKALIDDLLWWTAALKTARSSAS